MLVNLRAITLPFVLFMSFVAFVAASSRFRRLFITKDMKGGEVFSCSPLPLDKPKPSFPATAD
jgi:hypothetical protein